jgi:uracil-DNA glycosylase family 4
MTENPKNWRIIPEYPSYDITRYTKCQNCPKYEQKKKAQEKLEKHWEHGVHLDDSVVFIEHFPPEFIGEPDTKRLMLIGEAPGAREMVHYRPFIGESGQLLRQALTSLKFVRKTPPIIRILITNSVKCRCIGPPNIPVMNACAGALAQEADLFSPDTIIGLGKTAFHALTDKGFEHLLGENRRKQFTYRGFPVRLTYHPAAAKRHMNYRVSMFQDLRKYLNELIK